MGKLKKDIFNDKIAKLIPVIIFCASIMIIRMHKGSYPYGNYYWASYDDTTLLTDLFCYYKQVAIYIAAFIAIVYSIVRVFSGRAELVHNKPLYGATLTYAFMIIFSFIFSSSKYFALHGMNDHFQGTIVLLCYLVLYVYIYNFLRDEFSIKVVVNLIVIFVLLINLLGLGQGFGYDLLKTSFGQKLITPYYIVSEGISSWRMIDLLKEIGQPYLHFNFDDNIVYQTVLNPNYVPFYLSLILPVIGMLFIYYWQDAKKSFVFKIVYITIFALCVYNFFAANSVSGFFGVAAIIILAVPILNKKIITWLKPIICIVLVSAIVMVSVADRWLPEVKNLISNTENIARYSLVDSVYASDVQPSEYAVEHFDTKPASKWASIDYIDTRNQKLVFSVNGNPIIVTRNVEMRAFEAKDSNGDTLILKTGPDTPGDFEIMDSRFHDYVLLTLAASGDYSYVIFGMSDGSLWAFRYTGEGFLYTNFCGKEVNLYPIKHWGFENNYSFGTYRGLIWATSIPLLKKYILVGAGADCFTIAYPQNDYATMYTSGVDNYSNRVTDKAHNLYIQMWIETGLVSLLAWLTIVMLYVINSCRRIKSQGIITWTDYLNTGIMFGIIGFMVTGIFNDISINTMPLFYTLLGIGYVLTDNNHTHNNEIEDDLNNATRYVGMPEL